MNTARLQIEKLTLQLRNPFHLSYGVSEKRNTFWIRLASDEGWGEGTIPPYYRVDQSEMTAYWERVAAEKRALPDHVEVVASWIADGPPAARCGVELALLDRIGKRCGMPLYKLLDLPKPSALPTAFTISIDSPEAMAHMAKQIANYPMIKLKLGSDDDESRLRAVREARPDAKICVDANAAWTLEQAIEHLSWLEKFDIELIEQPLARDRHAAMGELQKRTQIPIVADESVQTLDDVEKLGAARVKGINVKLMKTGGVLPALAMIKRARELKMKVMLGCMIETSIGITAMGHLAGLADWLDLDSPLLITNDPFGGIKYDDHARISVPERPGIGVVKR